MDSFLMTALYCTLTWTSAGCAQSIPLASSVRDCGAKDDLACGRVARQVEALFAGGSEGADRAIAHRLASAAVRVIRQEATTPAESTTPERRVLVESLRRCTANEREECNRVATVLSGLFTGGDAQLDSSPDGRLARAFANRLLSITADPDERTSAAHSYELRR
jgi:hypothetical protein